MFMLTEDNVPMFMSTEKHVQMYKLTEKKGYDFKWYLPIQAE